MTCAPMTDDHHHDDTPVEALLEDLDRVADSETRRRLRTEVILRTLRVADALAHRYTGRGVDTQDLEQVARCALIAAVDRYQPDVGRGFLAFAVPTITGEIKRYFRDHAWSVRPPRRLQELRARIAAAETELLQQLGRSPSREELADEVGISVPELVEARSCDSAFRPRSLESPTVGSTPVGDTLRDGGDQFETWVTDTVLRELLARLPERDRMIVSLRFDDELSQTEIGEAIGVTQMQVSRLLSRILGSLRGELLAEAS